MSQVLIRSTLGSLSLGLLACGAPVAEPASAVPVKPAVAETAPTPVPAPSGADGQAAAEASATPSAEASATPGARLLVGGEAGLREFDLDGAELSQLTTAPAHRPRRLDDGSVLFVEESEEKVSLRRYSPKGEVVDVAEIPAGFDGSGCKLSPSGGTDATLSVHADHSFTVDRDKGQACLTLADRNVNMADVSFAIRVELDSGKVESSLELDNINDCAPGEALACNGTLGAKDRPVAAAGSKWAWEWDADAASLFPAGSPGHKTAKRLCGADVDTGDADSRVEGCASNEGRSASGRFVLVSGPISEGDYIHRELFVLDLQSGEVLGLMGDKVELRPVTPADVVTEGFGSVGAVGESDVRWLEGDRLWIDGVLVNPVARRSTQIEGELAW